MAIPFCPTCKTQWLSQAVTPWSREKGMIVMPANQTNELVHLWSAMYGNVALLYTPARKERIRPWLPYVLDNGQYANVENGRELDPVAFEVFIDGYAFREYRPWWLVVPDMPFDSARTLAMWDEWEPKLRHHGIPLALAVQDGMTVADAKATGCDVAFVGGSTEWKWTTAPAWMAASR